MMRGSPIRYSLWILLWTFCGFVSSVQAADPAAGVPDSASIVIRLKAPQATFAKLGSYADIVQPGFGDIVSSSLPSIGGVIKSPQLVGVDVENDWWAIVFAESEEEPAVVFIIPATDAAAIEKALPEDFEFHKSGNLAVFSDDEEALGKVRDQLAGTAAGIWAKVDASSKKLFDSSDLSVLVNVSQLAQEFKGEIDEAEPKLNALIDQITDAIPESQRTQVGPVFDIYRQFGKGILQAVKESKSWTAGLVISKTAVRLETQLSVNPDTATAKFLGSQPTGDLSLVGRLPAGKSIYFAAKADMKGMIEWSMNMTKSFTSTMSDQQKADFDAAVKQMSGLEYGSIAGYFDIEPKLGDAARTGSVAEVTPTDRMRDISRSLIKAMAKLEMPQFKQTTTLEPAAVKVDGVEVDRITIKQEFDNTADPQGFQNKFRDVLFGNAGMQQLAMYQQKRVLQTMGGGTEEIQKFAASLNSTPAKDSGTVAARARFLEKANIITLIDLPRMVVNGAKLAIEAKAVPGSSKSLDGFKLTPSYVGFALACEPTTLKTQFEIPVEQAQGIAQLVSVFMMGLK